MSYCVNCGTQVTPGTQVCPQCGKPPGGRKPTNWPLIAIIVGGGCLLFIVFSGIIAALIIPNFLDALQKAKQKRTVADLRDLGTAVFSYATDNDGVLPEAENVQDLSGLLVPKYIAAVPTLDGWKRPYRYLCWRDSSETGCDHFRLASAGRDGVFEAEDLRQYEEGTFEVTDYNRDIVVGDGFFVQYPARLTQPSP